MESIRASVDLVLQGRCILCAPSSCVRALAGIRWVPLVDPASHYPWSVVWRADDHCEPERAVIRWARALSRAHGWLPSSRQASGTG